MGENRISSELKLYFSMVTIESFLEEEINECSRKVILGAIRNGRKFSKEKEEIIFNRFSVEISFLDGKVSVYDNVFSEDEPLEMRLEDFVRYIKK